MGGADASIASVTGGVKGIGQATAEMLAADGTQLVVTDVDEEAGTKTVDSSTDVGGEAVFSAHDMAYAVVYLAPDESTFTAGSEFVLDGGFTTR